MTRDDERAASELHREEHRRAAAWVTAAVGRNRIAQDALTAATVVSDALDALGIESRVAAVGAIVDAGPDATPRVYGEHAVAVAAGAGVVADAFFGRFGTRVPYLVADVSDGSGAFLQQIGSTSVMFVPSGRTPAIPDADRGLVMALALEIAGVGSHVMFEADALVTASRPLFPSWARLRDAFDNVDGDSTRRLAAFRARRNDHLVELGYPWSLEDPFVSPLVTAA